MQRITGPQSTDSTPTEPSNITSIAETHRSRTKDECRVKIPDPDGIYIGVDTGTVQTAIVALKQRRVIKHDIVDNVDVIGVVLAFAYKDIYWDATLAIEMFEGRGQIAGQSSYDSIFMAGRIAQAWIQRGMLKPVLIYRREVKASICGDMRARDSNIRQAVLDEFEPSGGGAVPQVGTKKAPGPLYGISKDKWSALAIAITAQRGQFGKVRIKL